MLDEKTTLGHIVSHHFTRSRYKSFVLACVALFLFFFILWQINDLVVRDSITRALSQIRTSIREQTLINTIIETPREDEDLIPHKIWQIMLSKKHHLYEDDDVPIDPATLQDTSTWLAMNPEYA